MPDVMSCCGEAESREHPESGWIGSGFWTFWTSSSEEELEPGEIGSGLAGGYGSSWSSTSI
ncbi:MAG: hypothetical protein MJE68_31185, partial [Proteobacteria bacterium]|nr:hypothetical protein [Pseudomonadota bacterium]